MLEHGNHSMILLTNDVLVLGQISHQVNDLVHLLRVEIYVVLYAHLDLLLELVQTSSKSLVILSCLVQLHQCL